MTRSLAIRNSTWAVFVLLALALWPARPGAVELCSPEANRLMRSAGITDPQIAELCRLASQTQKPLAISFRRKEDEMGYCRVTLALKNNTVSYLNHLALTTENGQFEIFRFHNILPGDTGYTSAISRSLMDCSELEAIGVHLLWPASLKVDDQSISGRRLEQFKPHLDGPPLFWVKR